MAVMRRTLLLAAMISIAPTAMVMAQTEPQSTSPSSGSYQRTTPTNPPESTPPDQGSSTSPSAASSPHQREATSGSSRTASKQSMKECIAKQQSDNSGMSKEDAKKACKAQMKGPG
jgi:hypothetical protein